MHTAKIILLVGVTVAATVLIGQNTEVVDLRLLFWSVSVSRIILLVGAMAIGFTAGFVTAVLVRPRAVTQMPVDPPGRPSTPSS